MLQLTKTSETILNQDTQERNMFVLRILRTPLKYSIYSGVFLTAFTYISTPNVYPVDLHSGTLLERPFKGGSIYTNASQAQVHASLLISPTIGIKSLSQVITNRVFVNERLAAEVAEKNAGVLKKGINYLSSISGLDLRFFDSFINSVLDWNWPNRNSIIFKDRCVTYANSEKVIAALKTLDVSPGNGYSSRLIENSIESYDGGVLLEGSVGNGALDYNTLIQARLNPHDKLMVDLRIGQAYRVNNEWGYVYLPFTVAYFWVVNRFAVQKLVSN